MTAHAIVIDTRPADDGAPPFPRLVALESRWRCSCGTSGEWTPRAKSARTGGQRHVAAMERGRDPFAVLCQPGKGGARTTEGRERAVARFERRAAIARRVMRGGK